MHRLVNENFEPLFSAEYDDFSGGVATGRERSVYVFFVDGLVQRSGETIFGSGETFFGSGQIEVNVYMHRASRRCKPRCIIEPHVNFFHTLVDFYR